MNDPIKEFVKLLDNLYGLDVADLISQKCNFDDLKVKECTQMIFDELERFLRNPPPRPNGATHKPLVYYETWLLNRADDQCP